MGKISHIRSNKNIDISARIDVTSRLNKEQARKLLVQFFRRGVEKISFSKHCLIQIQHRNLITGDIYNVVKAGDILRDSEFENGTWRYRIETKNITVIFTFRTPDQIVILTAWRNK